MCSWQICNQTALAALRTVPISKILTAKTTGVVQPLNLTLCEIRTTTDPLPMYTHMHCTPHHGDTSVELAQDT